jgi:hypothetical protein
MDCEEKGVLERSGRGHFAPAIKNDSTEFTKKLKYGYSTWMEGIGKSK